MTAKNEVLRLKLQDINLKTKTYKIPALINKAKRNMIYFMSYEQKIIFQIPFYSALSLNLLIF